MPHKQPLPDKGIVRVTFTLPAKVEGRVVHLVGEFTGWEGTPMERQRDGSWKTVVDLAPGRSYQFRYHIDGERWENDWEADGYVANPFGQENSLVETPALKGAHGARSLRQTAAKPKASGKAAGAQATGRNTGTTQAERELATSPAATGAGAAGGADASSAAPGSANKAPAKKASARKTPARKAPAKKAAGKKTAAKKAAAKKTPVKKTSAKKPARKAPAKKKTAQKAAGKKAPAKRGATAPKAAEKNAQTAANTTPQENTANASSKDDAGA